MCGLLHIDVSTSFTIRYAAIGKKYDPDLANLLFFRMFGDLPAFRAFTAAFGTFCSHIQPFKTMRVVVDPQFKLGQVPIDQIKFDPKDRDDIPAVLRGLQHLYMDDTARTKIFEILEKRLLPDVDLARGRPGMPLWCIYVLGVVKMAIDCDFDRLRNLADHHGQLRQMLGHTDFYDEPSYHLQTIIDNVSLLTEDVLEEINEVVVACGHRLVKKKRSGDSLRGRVDSSVAKTNVEWPTDVGLLRDAVRCLVRELRRTCKAHGIAGWRKSKYWLNELRRAFYAVRTHRRWYDVSKVEDYLDLCCKLVRRAEDSVRVLKKRDIAHDKIRHYLEHAQRQIDQVDRRLIKGEAIPHEEKVFSIHEPHTRWVNKGKAGVMAELGLPVCVLEDQYQFILQHEVLLKGGDSEMIVPFLKKAKERYQAITSCSMDKGYYSASNRQELDRLLEWNVMPKKGRRSQQDWQREQAPAFAEARRQHPAVESAINNLNQRGLSLIRTHGEEGFVRTVALVVVAANVHRLGLLLKEKGKRRRRWYQARSRAA